MTVTTTTNTVVYRGNSSATQFAVPFLVLDEDHLVVKRRVYATGVVDTTYIGTDYSYSGIGDPAGTLTLDGAALSSTYEIVIQRIVPYTQDLDLVNAGGFYPETVEEQLDLLAMQIQQVNDGVQRSIRLSPGETASDLVGLGGRTGGMVLGFNSTTGALELVEQVGETGATGAQGERGEEVSNAASSRPAFVELLATGTIPDVPDNVRTGLSADTFASGGYLVEMEIPVTGTAGSEVLTSTDALAVSGLGADPFDAALNSTDGTEDIFVTVRSHNGSTTITLDQALERDFVGVLVSRNPVANDQHITQGATRALAQLVANETGLFTERGETYAAEWLASGAEAVTLANTQWVRNAALIAYGVSNSAAPIVQTSLQALPLMNYVVGKIPVMPLGGAGIAGQGIYVGTHTSGHGAERSIALGGKAVAIEFWTSAWRDASVVLTDTALTVTVSVDGTVIYSVTASDLLRRHQVFVPAGFTTALVSVVNADGAIYHINVPQLSVREPGVGGRLYGKRGVIFMDSWGAYYDGLFGDVLAEKTGATIVDHSSGGKTTQYFLSWFDEHVRDEKPDFVIMNSAVNDMNGLSAQTFVAPDGSTPAMWPYTIGQVAESIALWKTNIVKLAQKCAEHGIKLIWLMPPAVAGLGQSQSMMETRWHLDVPPVSGVWPPEIIPLIASDETTALTTGNGKLTFRMPYAFRVTGLRGSLGVAQASGSTLTVDVNDSGTTILSTKLTFDNTEKTTTTAAAPLVISDYILADDAEITVDIDQVGDGTAKGLKLALYGRRIA